MSEKQMQDKLRMLFDFQRFVENPELSQLIRQTAQRYLETEREIADEDFAINAAGDIFPKEKEGKE